VLLGGDGDDLLVGQSGRDLLVAGDGADRIVGNADDDLLISGMLSFADQDAAIAAIMAEWTSSNSYAARIANLSGKTEEQGNADFAQRHNENYFLLLAVTVISDDDRDTLTGSAGEDWFWYDPELDKVTDLGDEAFADDLSFITG
jgi:Ca2+-binding RTX toxin-like protein